MLYRKEAYLLGHFCLIFDVLTLHQKSWKDVAKTNIIQPPMLHN